MRRSTIVLIVAAIVSIAAFASVSLGLSHVQAMMGTAGFSGMGDHMGGSAYSGHEDMHNQLNMTEHMQDMYEGNMTTSHMENNHGDCHD
jgi:Spy/CpxP family protein refolding chaperone